MTTATLDHDVLVIGAGFSGIGAAIGLRKAGIENFIIVDEWKDVGGTWHANTYPGISVDVPGFSYSFAFEPFSSMSSVFPAGAELKTYAHHCVRTYGLAPHLRLGSKVDRAAYDEDLHGWRVDLENGRTFTTRFIICATGWLTKPKLPDIRGLSRFQGDVVHTAKWDDALKLEGRRVAVIGTGASAVQLVPVIAPEVQQLSVFQRTAVWLFPKPEVQLPKWLRKVFQTLPWTYRAVRLLSDLVLEVSLLGLVYNRQLPFMTKLGEAWARFYLKRQVGGDPELIRKLTPTYGLGCKRPSADRGFWKSFTRKNVELVTDGIDEITETGIRTTDGVERPFDTLVLATGFHVLDNLPPLKVFGHGGRELHEFWNEERFQAFEGSSVKGFPNLWFIMGVYSFTGGSWFKAIDYQVEHAVRVIREARRRGATEAMVRAEKHDASFQQMLGRQPQTVFFSGSCGGSNSYYFDARGDAPAVRPATTFEAAWRARHFDLDDYLYKTPLKAGA